MLLDDLVKEINKAKSLGATRIALVDENLTIEAVKDDKVLAKLKQDLDGAKQLVERLQTQIENHVKG